MGAVKSRRSSHKSSYYMTHGTSWTVDANTNKHVEHCRDMHVACHGRGEGPSLPSCWSVAAEMGGEWFLPIEHTTSMYLLIEKWTAWSEKPPQFVVKNRRSHYPVDTGTRGIGRVHLSYPLGKTPTAIDNTVRGKCVGEVAPSRKCSSVACSSH